MFVNHSVKATTTGANDQQGQLRRGQELPPVEKRESPKNRPLYFSHNSLSSCQVAALGVERMKLLESASQIRLPLWQPPTRANEEMVEEDFEDMINRLRSEIADDNSSECDTNATDDDISITDSLCAGYLEKQGMQRARRLSNAFSGQHDRTESDGKLQLEWGIMRNVISSRTA